MKRALVPTATARLASSSSTSAGGFTATDTYTQVICSNSNFRTAQRTTTGACSSTNPLMYVEQTQAGTRLGTTGSITFAFDWKAPATDVGPVTIYIAGNAANGNNTDDTGDHVYTASCTLTAATSCDAANSPGTGCRTWNNADFTNGTPTALDGVSVSIGGQPAYVYFISPTQINVQAPDVTPGNLAVTVTNSNGTSNAMTTSLATAAPAFFQASTYAIATHLDGSLVLPTSILASATPAAKGETIVLWGTGFGPVNPNVPAGKTSAQALGASTFAYAALPTTITIGGVQATVVYDILSPSAMGLYQIAITVPANAPSGDQQILATVGSATSPSGGLLSVK